ncbi:hypothetical protein ZIOFF_069199 [Zingiber officinale]|uniref:Uncharacterized protein n=1 Tax=Zingiber officinale TaxID=94328 RepID=A0A8J5C5M8_ZINOF|nr:hypothetical protein ZIOFF_069199 [Zingiber officinale]
MRRSSFIVRIALSTVMHPAASARLSTASAPHQPTVRVSAMVDEIARLSLLEVADRTEALRVRLGVQQMPVMVILNPGMGGPSAVFPGAGAAAVPEEKEKTAFDLKLESFEAASKIKIIKELFGVNYILFSEVLNLCMFWNQRSICGIFSPAVIGSTVSWGLYFFFYSRAKSRYLRGNDEHASHILTPHYHLISASEAGSMVSAVIAILTLVCYSRAKSRYLRGNDEHASHILTPHYHLISASEAGSMRLPNNIVVLRLTDCKHAIQDDPLFED